jgi:hypothetical protein
MQVYLLFDASVPGQGPGMKGWYFNEITFEKREIVGINVSFTQHRFYYSMRFSRCDD